MIEKMVYGEGESKPLDAEAKMVDSGAQNVQKTYTIDPSKFYVLTGVQRYNDVHIREAVYKIAYGELFPLNTPDSCSWAVILDPSTYVLTMTAEGGEQVSFALVEVG